MEINNTSKTMYERENSRDIRNAAAGSLTAAIICEYNPFHNGHRRHIELTRSLYGAENIVAIMSGNFVQRGDCAIFTKQLRTKAALLGGADIVFELPLPWCMAAAERFAFGGVSLAADTGAVDMLSFGSECGDVSALTAAADILDGSGVYERSRELQKNGMTFAAARSKAAAELYRGEKYDIARILESPNDILGTEYIRAVKKLCPDIRPVCVRRNGEAHDSAVAIPGKKTGCRFPGGDEFPSASTLRGSILSGCSYADEALKNGVPARIPDMYKTGTVTRLDRLDRLILAKLRLMSEEDIAALPDISEGLEHRIYRAAGSAVSFGDLCAKIKCRRYTLSRIRRVLLYALLGVPAGYLTRKPPYLRLLGMNANGEKLLRAISPAVPIIATYADAQRLGGFAREIYELNRRACEIYSMCSEPPLPRGCDFSGGVVLTRDGSAGVPV